MLFRSSKEHKTQYYIHNIICGTRASLGAIYNIVLFHFTGFPEFSVQDIGHIKVNADRGGIPHINGIGASFVNAEGCRTRTTSNSGIINSTIGVLRADLHIGRGGRIVNANRNLLAFTHRLRIIAP